jgi:SAM-dependent methyltransferase
MARKNAVLKAVEQVVAPVPLRLDIGCGKNKKDGYTGVDQFAIPGVDVVTDLRQPFPWTDNAVDEVHCSHFIEHLQAPDRVRFMNELYRVMKPGAKATLVAPHWCSNRAYGDMTHCWPPVAEMWFYYLSAKWREEQVPHTDQRWNPEGYCCDFEATWGYALHPAIMPRNQEYQQHAMAFFKEAAQDIIATLVCRKG